MAHKYKLVFVFNNKYTSFTKSSVSWNVFVSANFNGQDVKILEILFPYFGNTYLTSGGPHSIHIWDFPCSR